ncbi:MAG: tRNA (N6-threonylcarbamoyladenosine(37)-N6)-methyltransferase TrmO [Methanospirillum sp.]|uniref:tRNA (N6-threonylcarbamoyladenosine(37)-N6)-methyltransferase TrmO n=1 Tax=Methanospirillum sp. TaxID=45200 RepID=UPI00236AAF46|nr:tRNA (N6-threonylcarbamoyladenosine(37)-N6)-methyltransferase TrmO [Methanospirillum sp.]MDD1728459.1 tRNA (N6-threonylcarbamoyladenosine(37)-N6)-methyltransferase TrmO [Methanospirillum sp.]
MIELTPIGIISSPYKTRQEAPHQGRGRNERSTITIYPQFRDGLGEMIGISHIWVLFWMDRAERDLLLARRPDWKEARPVFTIRSPARPNPIALSIGRIISLDNGVITVSGIEALDGSPVIDIKPYVPDLDCIPDSEFPALPPHEGTRIQNGQTPES